MKNIIIKILSFYLLNVLIYIILKSIFTDSFVIFTWATFIVPLISIFISQIFAFTDIFITKKTQKTRTIKTFLIIATTINFSFFTYSSISEWHYNKTKKNIDSNLNYLKKNFDEDSKLAIKRFLDYFNQSNSYLIKFVDSKHVDSIINERKINGTQITIWYQTTQDRQIYKSTYLVINQNVTTVSLSQKADYKDILHLDTLKQQIKVETKVLFDSFKIDTRQMTKELTDF